LIYECVYKCKKKEKNCLFAEGNDQGLQQRSFFKKKLKIPFPRALAIALGKEFFKKS